MGIAKTLFVSLMATVCLEVSARPVSYADSYTLMGKSDSFKDTLYLHYSPSHRYSIGIETVNDKLLDTNYAHFRFTYLLHRKNTSNSQRNLYFQSGISSKGIKNYFYGLQGDWETRRFFSGFEYKQTKSATLDYSEGSWQLGFAPYIGDYGDLHTWLLLKTTRNTVSDQWDTYPVLKIFKGSAMLEIGYSRQSDLDLHLMYRF